MVVNFLWRQTTSATSKALTHATASSGCISTTIAPRPLSVNRLNQVRTRVVTNEAFDPSTRKTIVIAAFPLRMVRNRSYLSTMRQYPAGDSRVQVTV